MKPTPVIPDLYTKWLQPGWDMAKALLPGQPARDPAPRPSPAPAEQEWEDEGGTIHLPRKPRIEEPPKLPL